MADPFLGEIRLFAGSFAPSSWAFCDGSRLSVQRYGALFALIGATFGGDGVTDFALPDLRGRLPVGTGQGVGLTTRQLGATFGSETVSLNLSAMPSHTHDVATATSRTTSRPAAGVPGPGGAYGSAGQSTAAAEAVQPAGRGEGHENRPPSLAMSYIISLAGRFPSFP